MKAYKATMNGKCINITFEVGKTYTFNGELIMCKQGFHFCYELKDVVSHYPPAKEVKVMEIDVLGDIRTQGNKSVTNKFKVIRFLSPEELPFILEKDERGNVVHIKCENVLHGPLEEWFQYDEKNNMIFYRDSYGFEVRQIYDDRNNLICSISEKGKQYKRTYDDRNNLIGVVQDDDISQSYEYDERNNLIHAKTFNAEGKLVYVLSSKYDENNNKIYEYDSYGREVWYTYDKNNNVIAYKDHFHPYSITIEGEKQ